MMLSSRLHERKYAKHMRDLLRISGQPRSSTVIIARTNPGRMIRTMQRIKDFPYRGYNLE